MNKGKLTKIEFVGGALYYSVWGQVIPRLLIDPKLVYSVKQHKEIIKEHDNNTESIKCVYVKENLNFEFEFIFILQRLQIRQDASFHLAVNTEL